MKNEIFLLKNNKFKIKDRNIINNVYISGLLIYSISRVYQNSLIFDVEPYARTILRIFSFLLMIIKVIFQEYNKRDLYIATTLFAFSFFCILLGADNNFIIIPTVLVGIKDLDIKHIVKLLLYVTVSALIIHLIAYVIYYYQYLAEVEGIPAFRYSWYCKEKALLYGNVNMYAFRYVCALLQYIFITNRNIKRVLKVIMLTILSIFVFAITNSWTSLYISLALVSFLLIEKIEPICVNIYIFKKIVFISSILFSFLIIIFGKYENNIISNFVNKLLTNRPHYIYLIVNKIGIHLLPNYSEFDKIWKYFGEFGVIVPDNSYISTLLKLGIIFTFVLCIFVYNFAIKNKNERIIDYFICVICILFIFEYVSNEITMYTLPLIIMNQFFKEKEQ